MNQPVAMLRFASLFDANGNFLYKGLIQGGEQVDFIGPDSGILESGVEATSEGDVKNPCIHWTIRRTDGGIFRPKKPFTGQERETGKPLDRQGCDMLSAIGWTPEQIEGWFRQLVAEGRQGLTSADIISVCVNKPVYFMVGEWQARDGTWLSTVDNWLEKQDFDRRMATPGKGRSPRPSQMAGNTPAGPNAGVVPVGPIGGPGARPGVAPPPASAPNALAPAIPARPAAGAAPTLPFPGQLPGVTPPQNGIQTPIAALPMPALPALPR